jgi:hypothetical protein
MEEEKEDEKKEIQMTELAEEGLNQKTNASIAIKVGTGMLN